ncbi:MAG: autotransporter-associated beta strand repeat-containing protein [Luteolibacter sp.]
MKPRYLTSLFLAAFAAQSASAAIYQWDTNGSVANLGGAGTWDTTSANWDLTTVDLDDGTDATTAYTFTSADTAKFGGTGGTVTFGTPVDLLGINITAAGYTMDFGANAVNIGSGGYATFNTSSGTNLTTVAGTVTNTGALAVKARNTFTLNSGANWTQSGALTIQASNGGNSPVLNVNTDATFKYTNATTAINLSNSTSTGTASGTLNIAGGKFETGKAFNNSGGTSTGSANLVLSNGGTLKLTANIAALATISGSSSQIKIQSGTGGGILDTNGFSTEITQGISGAGSLTKQGTGTLTLSGANTYIDITTVSGGTLDFLQAASFYNNTIDATTSANLTVASGATAGFSLGGGIDFTEANITTLLAASNGTVGFKTGSSLGIDTTNAGGTYALGLAIGNPNGNVIGLSKLGTGTLAISQANTYTGGTTINTGEVTVSGDQSAANGSWILRGGPTFNTTATAVTFNSGSTIAIASGKTVQLGNNGAAGGFQHQALTANGTVTNAGTLFAGRGGDLNVGGAWTQNGAATVASQGGIAASLTVASGGQFTYTSATNFLLSSSGSSNVLTKLTIDGGVMTTGAKFHNANATPATGTSSDIVLSSGGTLKLSANVADLFTTAGATTSFQLGTGGGIVDTNGSTTALNLPITGAGGLTKVGGGTLTTTGANTYTGNTTVTGGTLSVAGPNLDDTSSVSIASSAKLDLNYSGTDTVTSLIINGVTMPIGVYGAAGAGVTIDTAHFSGTGTLTVTTGPATATFATWASGLGLSGSANADFDKDGISDATEYVLGTNPKVASSTGITGQTSGNNLIFTFIRVDSSKTADITLTVESGTTLATWPQVFQIKDTTALSSPGVVITDNGATDTVTVTIPTGGAAKQFSRLKTLVSGS